MEPIDRPPRRADAQLRHLIKDSPSVMAFYAHNEKVDEEGEVVLGHAVGEVSCVGNAPLFLPTHA